MSVLSLFSVFVLVSPALILCENIFKINISPQEAQEFLDQTNLNVDYSPKTGENPLPEVRNAEGDFVYMGRKIDNPSDYVEEHYNAHQYHGQDGLGQYSYGYRDWNQGKNEKKSSTGKVEGTYKYVDPLGRDFIVTYWADTSGFHQNDNRPEAEKAPVTDTPTVKAAKEEHLRLWSELAAAAGKNPDPYSPEYQAEGQYDPSESEAKDAYVHVEPEYVPGPDETGEPRGFFYKFDYNTPLLRNKKEREELEILRAANNNQRN